MRFNHHYLACFTSFHFDCNVIFYLSSYSATKAELRLPGSEKFVTTVEGEKLKNKIGAFALVECSAKNKTNLAQVFEEAIRAVERKKFDAIRVVEKKKSGGSKPSCKIL